MTRYVITGGAGFVGRNLAARILASPDTSHVTVLDNERLSSRTELEGLDVEFVHGDVRDRDAVLKAFEGAETVIHLAADTRVMDSIENPDFNFENNVIGSFNVLVAARTAGVRNLVAASTGGAILGEAPAPIHEGIAAHPLAPYGASKLAMEGYLDAFAGAYGLKACALRFSNVYGPGSLHKGSVVAHFFKNILQGKSLTVYGDGSQVRDFLFIEDLAGGVLAALKAGVHGVYQLGSGRPTTVNELLDAMRRVVPDRHRIDVRYEAARAGEIHTTWCNISRAREAFGFDPSTSLDDGLRRTWDWFDSQRARLT